MDQFKTIIDVNVNGEMHSIDVPNNWTLLKVLRDVLGLTGTKCGCEKGQCGACTVLLNGKPVLSCLVLAASINGQEVTTIEGLGQGGNLHPIQEAFVKHHGLQCGFCTPGMIMSTKALLDENPKPTVEEIKFSLRGNLCRCGSYPKVIKAIQSVTRNGGKA